MQYKNKVLRILQLPHLFVGFTESFHLIGYLVNTNRELSPLYRAEHASINSEHDILDIIGILAIPNHDRIVFSEVYEKKMLSMLHDHSIRFHVAPFPDGFSPRGSLATIGAAPLHDFMFPAPCAAIEVTPLIYQFPPPVTLAAIEAAPVAYELEAAPFQHSISPADGYPDNLMFDDYQMAFNAPVGYADQTPITPTIVLHNRLIWKAITEALKNTPWNRPIFLTKCLYLGSLWVGLQNPWNLPDQQYRWLITSCFVMVIALSGTTMDELHDKLVTVAKGGMELASIGWETLRLTLPFLHKVNIFPMEPKSLRPRTCMNETTPLYEDLEPITKMVHNLTTLPNAEFTANDGYSNDMIIKDEALSALQNQISKMSCMVHTACMEPLPVKDGKVLCHSSMEPKVYQTQVDIWMDSNVVAPHLLAGIKNSFILAVSKVKSALRYIMIIVTIRAIID
ncbi:uncharacterized protein F5891DRAFT_983323 [Suillus fuscotomentosus]|uniref:Uncharacterized protein n=1 Tax=Suillus fuscotomentosus TaxID=1912939 RepID=A0AAD4DYZ4_9AGAM|nr:uncharacterized protein F5891DRAFT_983323 [Suillus fuscotomentosus]KAG1896723.1 hypothetical protein F5891DRAFT_983323 [Suillus fuscotomentosus]